MENPSPATPTAPEPTPDPLFQAPDLFRQAPQVGRPPSSTSTSEPPSPSTPPIPTLSAPAVSSTSPAPSSSTEPPAEPPAATAHPAPSGSSPSEPAPAGLRETLARTLTTATALAHSTLTDDVGRAHSLYLATEEEVHGAAEGAASILTRRLGPAVVGGEAGDIVQIALAVASYTTRQVRTWRQARADRAALKAQTEQQHAAA